MVRATSKTVSISLIVAAALLAAGFLSVWSWRGALGNAFLEAWREFRSPLPEARSYAELQPSPIFSPTPTPKPKSNSPKPAFVSQPAASGEDDAALPASMNLYVPFTSQAPLEDWELPFKEACEEASLLMVDGFYKEATFTKQGATNAIIALTNFQRNRFGYYEDTTAEETAVIAREYFGYANVKVVPGPLTAEMIKKEIAQGRPVILPMAGRLLGNIYFRRPGPYYHMLVVKGYTPTEFITNDPGTKRGHNYRYSYETLLNATHDFHLTDITTMPQMMIVVLPNEQGAR